MERLNSAKKMFRWYIPEMKVHLKRVLLAISLHWLSWCKSREKSYRVLSSLFATPKAGFENVVQSPNPNPQPHLDAGLQHLISTLCLIKKTGGRRWRSWSFSLMTHDYPYDTVKTPKKEQHLTTMEQIAKSGAKIQLETTLYTLKSKMTILFALEFRLKCNHFHNWNHRRKGNGWVRWKKQQICLPLFYDNTIYIYMYHIVPIVCVNSWLVSTNITFCAPNSLVTESQYLQHFLWSKKWER